jgi:hypothetical protein
MPFSTAAILGTTAASTTTIGGAAYVGTVTTWGVTAATIAADAALVTGGVSAFSQLQAGKQAEELGKSQEAIHAYNAMLDKREAAERLGVAGVEEAKFRAAGEKLKARQRVGFAKAGVTTEGTPMDTLEETAIRLETDALTIRRSGQIGERALTSSAQLESVAGRSALIRGRQRRRAGQYGAAGTAIGSLGQSIQRLAV